MWGKETMKGKKFYSVTIQTRQLQSLNEIYNLFYENPSAITNPSVKRKTIKDELFFYMDYLVLAH